MIERHRMGFWRGAIAGLSLAALALYALLRAGAPALYYALLGAQGIPKITRPFSDLAAVLQAVHCARAGVDVYVPNACMAGGVYNYSPLLFRLGFLGAGAGHATLLGFGLDFCFIAALAALPAPRSWAEFSTRAAASVSATSVFALERANIDVFVFLLAVLGVLLSLRGPRARLLGGALFCLAAAIKYYPAALLLLGLREPARRLIVLGGILAACGLVFLYFFGAGSLAALAIVPRGGPFGNCFGAVDVPLGLSLWLAAAQGLSLDISRFRLPPYALVLLAGLALLALRRGIAGAGLYRAAFARLQPQQMLFLIAGAGLLCGCFFMAQNAMYRAVFLLLTLPGLFALRDAAEAAARRQTGILLGVILFLLWEEVARILLLHLAAALLPPVAGYALDILYWVVREALWWWAAVQLLSLLVCYLQFCALGWRAGAPASA